MKCRVDPQSVFVELLKEMVVDLQGKAADLAEPERIQP
jgi:hypothetical protein